MSAAALDTLHVGIGIRHAQVYFYYADNMLIGTMPRLTTVHTMTDDINTTQSKLFTVCFTGSMWSCSTDSRLCTSLNVSTAYRIAICS
jgi:hypothetical protein